MSAKVYVSPIAPVSSSNHECVHARVVRTAGGGDGPSTTLFVPPFTPVVQIHRDSVIGDKGDFMPVGAHCIETAAVFGIGGTVQGTTTQDHMMLGVSLEGVDEGAAAEAMQCPEAGGLPVKVTGQAIVAYPFNELYGIEEGHKTNFYGKPVFVYPTVPADFTVRGDPEGFKRMKMGIEPRYGGPIDNKKGIKLGVLVGKPHGAMSDGIEAHITVYLDPFGHSVSGAAHHGPTSAGFADVGEEGGPAAKKRRCMAPDAHVSLLRCCAAAATTFDGKAQPRFASWLAPHGTQQVGNIDGLDVGLTFSGGEAVVPGAVAAGDMPTPAQALLLPAHVGDTCRPSEGVASTRQRLLTATAAFQHGGDDAAPAEPVHSVVSSKVAYAWGPEGSRNMLTAIAAPTVAAFALPNAEGKLRRVPTTRVLLHDDSSVHDAIASELADVVAESNKAGWGSRGKLTAADRDAKTAEIRARLASTVGPLL